MSLLRLLSAILFAIVPLVDHARAAHDHHHAHTSPPTPTPPTTTSTPQPRVPTTTIPQKAPSTAIPSQTPSTAIPSQTPSPNTALHPCICNTNHPQLVIFECPDRTSQIIGFLYLQDSPFAMDLSSSHCKDVAQSVISPEGWFPVLHDGKVGFIRRDSGVDIQNCPGPDQSISGIQPKPCQTFVIAGSTGTVTPTAAPTTTRRTTPSTTTTTTTVIPPPTTPVTTTTPVPTSTTTSPSTYDHACNNVEVILELGKHEPIYHAHARQCSGGDAMNEAVVMKFCYAPEPSSWTQGRKVIDHCTDIPPYTPINMFGFGQNLLISGIFVKCTNATEFMIIHQKDCIGGLHLETINMQNGSGMFYVVHW